MGLAEAIDININCLLQMHVQQGLLTILVGEFHRGQKANQMLTGVGNDTSNIKNKKQFFKHQLNQKSC